MKLVSLRGEMQFAVLGAEEVVLVDVERYVIRDLRDLECVAHGLSLIIYISNP